MTLFDWFIAIVLFVLAIAIVIAAYDVIDYYFYGKGRKKNGRK